MPASPIEKQGADDKSKQIRFHHERDRLLFCISPAARGDKRPVVPQALSHEQVVIPPAHTKDRANLIEKNPAWVLGHGAHLPEGGDVERLSSLSPSEGGGTRMRSARKAERVNNNRTAG